MQHTRYAMILAAGLGSRLEAEEGHKILARLGDRPLLDYHLENFARLGVTDTIVVTGYRREELEATLEGWPLPNVESPGGSSTPMRLHLAHNPDFRKSNGISILAGVDQVLASALPPDSPQDALPPFWLSMSDHLFEPALFDDLRAGFTTWRRPHIQGVLGIDRKLDTIFDMPDATKLRYDEHSLAISKELEPFDVVDVGLFWCGPGFVQALRDEYAERGDCSTSDAVRRLHATGQFDFWDVGPRLWQDVDTPGARSHAEGLLAQWARAD